MTSENIIAQQKINRMYLEATGAKSQLKAIQILLFVGVLFSIVSIAGSALGFNYDFKIFIPDWSIGVALLFAFGLEATRVGAIYGFFSFKDFITKAIFAAAITIVTILAIVLHIRGMQSMAIVKTNESIKEVVEYNRKLEMMNQKRADKLLNATISTQNRVLNNGTAWDDVLMVKSMRENNKIIASLSKAKKLTPLQEKYLEAQRQQALTLKRVGSIVLPLIEVFALLSVFGAFLKTRAVSEDTKEIVQEQHKADEVRATILPHKEEPNKNFVNFAKDKIRAKLEQDIATYHPTLPQETVKIRQNSPNFAETEPKQQKPENSECVGETVEGVSATHDKNYQQETQNENNSQKSIKLEDRYIDLASFEFKEAELLKILFKNGAINQPKEGLLPKRIVVDEYIKSQQSTKREAIDLYEKVLDKLVDEQFVYFSGRYKSACRGIKTVVAIEQGSAI